MADTVACARCGSVRMVTDAIIARKPKLMSVTPAGQNTVLYPCPVCTFQDDVFRNMQTMADILTEIRVHLMKLEAECVEALGVELEPWQVEVAKEAVAEVATMLKETETG